MQTFLKKVRCAYCVTLVLFLFVLFYSNSNSRVKNIQISNVCVVSKPAEKVITKKLETKYILLWTDISKIPFSYFEEGDKTFVKKKCKFVNCYVTSNRNLLGHYREFDVIAFNGPQIRDALSLGDLPILRHPHQKYVYVNIEAAQSYPVCTERWNGFFNWTWTYKLNSDIVWGYFSIRNKSNHVIGPNVDMNWIAEDKMDPIDDDLKKKLASKSRPAAWFVSNCITRSKRELYFNTFQHYLGEYNLKTDVYGQCGDFQCAREVMDRCLDEVHRSYYFYLSFENTFSEDYITEKILHALRYYTVPIVYSGVNYTRFLPPGSYLDAVKLGPRLLAKKVYEIMQNPELYYSFFKWRKYYSYHLRKESPETDEYCSICDILNNGALVNKTTIYKNFSNWWSAGSGCSTT